MEQFYVVKDKEEGTGMCSNASGSAEEKIDFCLPLAELPGGEEMPSHVTEQMLSAVKALSGSGKSFASDLDEVDDPSGIPIIG